MTDILARLTTSLADRYQIERELGQGGMAVVYLARDLRHDRKVALKVLRAELAAILGGDRFLQEIRTTANLQHPHILPLHDSGSADGIVYYVMPYIDGESLRDRITREKQLPVDEAVRIAREVASALDYAHRQSVVHRDIKPENILLHDGQAVVADFGIALAASRSDGATRMTETGMSLGTPHYMAPEQAMGDREITPRADIYALGCVTYEMLTGEPPFTGTTAQAIVARVVTESPRALTLQRHTVPSNVEAAVMKALEKLPADRFGTAAEFSAALGNPSFAHGVQAHGRTGVQETAGYRLPVTRYLSLAPLGIAALAVAFAAWSFTRDEPPAFPEGRFSISLPGASATGAFAPVLSPDGSKLLFIGQDSQRVSRVYLRPLDRETPIPVPGTEGTLNSAQFSPDGEWILFRQGGKLRKVAVAGGAPLVICDLVGGLSGSSWGSRDVIAFVRGDSLFRVPSAGGTPVGLAGADSASGTLRYLNPHFLPDGRHLVAARLTRGGPELVTIDTDDGEVTGLGVAGLTPWYVSSGWLLYADAAGTLLAAPFDARRRRFTGEAQPVAEQINVAQGTFARFSASRSGSIAYFTGGASDDRELVVADRTGRVQALEAPRRPYRFARFSPDGRRIAVSIDAPGRLVAGDIWTYDLGSRRLSRLTSDTSSFFPEWSPDGRSIVYARLVGAKPELWRVPADGSADPAPFFVRPNPVSESQLMPDGRTIVFREDHPANVRDIHIAPVDSPDAVRALAATAFNERSPALTRDGRWLAYASNVSGASEIYLRRTEDGSPRWRVSTNGGVTPRWGAGGRELFYLGAESLYVVSVTLGAEPVLGQPRALFGGNFLSSNNEALFDVSPDGQRFVLIRLSGVVSQTPLHLIFHRFDRKPSDD